MAKRLAFVTGGMGGIGTAICHQLCKDGLKVIAGSRGARDHAAWISAQRAAGHDIDCAFGDVTNWDSMRMAFEKIRGEHGEVDVLVNNAGITRDSVFRRMNLDDWNAVISTNLTSLFIVTKQVIDGMVERGWGRVINISSINGQKGQFGQANYSAAKAGIHGFTMAVAQEVGCVLERLDTLERLLVQSGALQAGALQAYVPDPAVARQRPQRMWLTSPAGYTHTQCPSFSHSIT